MQTTFYILASIAAVLVIIAVPVLTVRAMSLMARMDGTRSELAKLLAESSLSLEHANRTLARTQEGIERMRHVTERLDKLLAAMQPAAVAGGFFRRLFGGPSCEPPSHGEGETS